MKWDRTGQGFEDGTQIVLRKDQGEEDTCQPHTGAEHFLLFLTSQELILRQTYTPTKEQETPAGRPRESILAVSPKVAELCPRGALCRTANSESQKRGWPGPRGSAGWWHKQEVSPDALASHAPTCRLPRNATLPHAPDLVPWWPGRSSATAQKDKSNREARGPFLTCVRADVPLQVEGVIEALAAEGAQVLLHLVVALEVPVKHALQAEGLAAQLTAVGRGVAARTCGELGQRDREGEGPGAGGRTQWAQPGSTPPCVSPGLARLGLPTPKTSKRVWERNNWQLPPAFILPSFLRTDF